MMRRRWLFSKIGLLLISSSSVLHRSTLDRIGAPADLSVGALTNTGEFTTGFIDDDKGILDSRQAKD
jgi:hypothetical protein